MELKKASKLRYLEPQGIAASGIASAGFTTRHEGVSRPPYNSLNLGLGTADSPHSVQGNRSLLARAFGTKVEQLLTVTQVHGSDLLVVDAPNADVSHFLKVECDGIITNQPGLMIGIGVADCLPLLLLDPVRQAAAALHAGWKGTASGIARKGVEALVSLFGSDPGDIIAAIGPGIGPCCYEVDRPVQAAFAASQELWKESAQETGEGKWRLDLTTANRRQLIDCGVPAGNIDTTQQCVCCTPELFFSYRRDKGETGRQMGFIMLRK
jgi:YfiH family protein